MTNASVTGHRGASVAVLVVGGGGLAAARNHGNIGGYGVICFVGGVTYALSLLVLKRRG